MTVQTICYCHYFAQYLYLSIASPDNFKNGERVNEASHKSIASPLIAKSIATYFLLV